MMNGRRAAAAAILGLVLAGCSGADFTPTSNTHYLAWGDLVQVFDKPPPVYYIRIGMLTVHGGWSDTEASMIETLKSAAARQGANAIVLVSSRQLVGHNMVAMPEYDMTAMAIRTVR
jgi:hypothetical protein